MSMYLDLDDCAADHPEAKAELEKLRSSLISMEMANADSHALVLGLEENVSALRSERDRLREALVWIVDIGFDHDGYTSAEDLGDLIDELVAKARVALKGEG